MDTKTLLESLTPALETYQEIRAELEARGLDPDCLAAVMAIHQALGQPAPDPDAQFEALFAPRSPAAKTHYRGVPYSKITGSWFVDGNSPRARIDELNRLVRCLLGNWEFSEFYIGGYRREFPYRLVIDDHELDELAEESAGLVKLIYKNQDECFLTIECDLFREEPLLISVTSFHPNFVQGVHEMETDFFNEDRDRLLAVMLHLQESGFPGYRKFEPNEIALEEMGDRYTICFFDE